LGQAWAGFSAGGTVDFGNLPEKFQRKVISEVHLPEFSSWLENALRQKPRKVDTTPWTLASYAKKLESVINALEAPAQVTWIPPSRILDQFLTTDKFHFLRSRLTLSDSQSTTA
jgi:hypothetical protein